MWPPAPHQSLKLYLTWKFALLYVGDSTIRGHFQVTVILEGKIMQYLNLKEGKYL